MALEMYVASGGRGLPIQNALHGKMSLQIFNPIV